MNANMSIITNSIARICHGTERLFDFYGKQSGARRKAARVSAFLDPGKITTQIWWEDIGTGQHCEPREGLSGHEKMEMRSYEKSLPKDITSIAKELAKIPLLNHHQMSVTVATFLSGNGPSRLILSYDGHQMNDDPWEIPLVEKELNQSLKDINKTPREFQIGNFGEYLINGEVKIMAPSAEAAAIKAQARDSSLCGVKSIHHLLDTDSTLASIEAGFRRANSTNEDA